MNCALQARVVSALVVCLICLLGVDALGQQDPNDAGQVRMPLAEFKAKASKIGIKQFVIQTHFESPMEITPESRTAVADLSQAGWTVTNQLVFTSAAARRLCSRSFRSSRLDCSIRFSWPSTE